MTEGLPPPPDDLRATVARQWGLQLGRARALRGGDECQVWVATAADRPIVVRLSPAWRSCAEIAWTHELVRSANTALPEAVPPLAGGDGRSVVACGGCPLTLWPYVPGRALRRDRHLERLAAAALLGRLHAATRLWRGGPRPGARPEPPPAPDEPPDLADPTLDAWYATRRTSAGDRRLPIHGDFYRRNLRWAQGRLTAILDWDEAGLDDVLQEAAWATWEFAKNAAGDDLRPRAAIAFVAAYRAAGGLWRDGDEADAVGFVRWRLRREIRRGLWDACQGRPHDPVYTAAELRAFRRLHGRPRLG